jgi:hypothetical protein
MERKRASSVPVFDQSQNTLQRSGAANNNNNPYVPKNLPSCLLSDIFLVRFQMGLNWLLDRVDWSEVGSMVAERIEPVVFENTIRQVFQKTLEESNFFQKIPENIKTNTEVYFKQKDALYIEINEKDGKKEEEKKEEEDADNNYIFIEAAYNDRVIVELCHWTKKRRRSGQATLFVRYSWVPWYPWFDSYRRIRTMRKAII